MRRVLITGASSGIGKAIAEKLLNSGDTVVGIARNFDALDTNHQCLETVSIDLADLAALPDQLNILAKRFPDIDTLVLCAGEAKFGCLEEFSFEQIRSMIDLNFTSHAFVVRAFIQGLKTRGAGNVIIIGSEAALQGTRKGTLYCAAKFATRGFAQALRDECAKSGVRVALINPGMVKTPFFDQQNFEPGEAQESHIRPEDIADLASTILNLPHGTVVEEINCQPMKKVIRFKSNE